MARIEIPENAADIASHIATADILFELGMMYCNGRGVVQDLVAAHKWFNLAALKGSEDARHYRCELSREMSSSQIHEAQRQARAWLTVH
jgi:TPR repeat protein